MSSYLRTTAGEPVDCGQGVVLTPRYIDEVLEGFEFKHPRKDTGADCTGWVPVRHALGWTTLGPVERVTLRPSLACRVCGAHGFITNGVWRSV